MRPHRATAFVDAAPIGGRSHRTRQTELLISERDRRIIEAVAGIMIFQPKIMFSCARQRGLNGRTPTGHRSKPVIPATKNNLPAMATV
jgi:hypothetical protein